MNKRIGFVAFAALAVVLLAAPAPASAQNTPPEDGRNLMLGVTFIKPGNARIGFQGALEIPHKDMGEGKLSFLVGGAFVNLEFWNSFAAGGGVKWTKPMADPKMKLFVHTIAGIVFDSDGSVNVAFSPGAGVLREWKPDMDFFAQVGLGGIRYEAGGGLHLGVQITAGVSKKLGR